MQKKLALLAAGLIMTTCLSACGKNSEMTQFKQDIDSFCTDISNIDTSMNNIDATSASAKTQLLGYLDELDEEFIGFAGLDFPEEFDYLETLADESSEYMTEAVNYYHKAYEETDKYNEEYATYATENYSRALKRVQIIITFLHGDEPTDADIQIQYE